MATYYRLLDPMRQFLDGNGDPYAGGKLYTYIAGTSTNKATFQDSAGAAQNTNPVILDSAGRVPYEVWGSTGAYKLVLYDADDALIDTSDNIDGINDVAAVTGSQWAASGLEPTYVSATSFTLAGDQTTEFHYGRRLLLTDSSTLYGFVKSATYSDPNTTVTVILDSGSLSASLSAVSYGLAGLTNTSIPYLPEQAAVSAKLLSNHTQTAATTVYEQIPLDDVTGAGMFDYGSNFDVTTGKDFTAPATGLYLVVGTVLIQSLPDGNYVHCAVYVNGSAVLFGTLTDNGGAATSQSTVAGIVQATAGQSIELWGRTDVGSGSTYIGGANGCNLRIARIG